MRRIHMAALGSALGLGLVSPLVADVPDGTAELVLNGEIAIPTRAPTPDHLEGLDEVISGWEFRTEETRVMQMDDFDNPGMLFVDQAREMWSEPMGAEEQTCSSCHGEPEELRGVRAVYPKWDEERAEVQTLEMQVNECVTERMEAEPLEYDGQPMRNMMALLSSVSRGVPVDVAIDGPAQSTWEQSREIYCTRYGQLELACANCHENNYGNMIRADHLSQGHINGFPTYRLRNAGLVSAHNRFRGCIRDTRGETFAVGSPEFVALELYVASRGNGLHVEGPSVRN